MGRLRLAVIGVGHLGKEHARILAGMPEVELVGVADVNAEQARAVAQRHGTRAFSDYRPLMGAVDAAVVAVPTVYHHAVARDFLGHGIPLLVEKPLASTLPDAEELVDLSRRKGIVLQVGHIERFNPAFEELQRLGLRPRLVQCQRMGPYTGRSTDIGVVLDLMIHDLDLLLALIDAPVREVRGETMAFLDGHEDVATAQLVFENGCVALLTASRVQAAPLRRMEVWCDEANACIDFARRHLCVVQRNESGQGSALAVREVELAAQDQLTAELRDFVACVCKDKEPRVSGEAALRALRVAERIVARRDQRRFPRAA